jgi:hypothetical protein
MTAIARAPSIGVIAGAGRLPVVAARALSDRGSPVVAVGFAGLTDAALESVVASFHWLRLGQLEALAATLRASGVTRVLLVGKVPKTLLFAPSGAGPSDIVAPDAAAIRLLGARVDRGDDALLGALVEWLAEQGFEICDQSSVLQTLRAPVGVLTRAAPDDRARRDLELGRPILRALGRAGVGQCIVMKAGAVLAVEAIEGTDEAIRRGGRLGGGGATVIKAARPGQDRRFDLPVVGPDTVAALADAGAGALAIEAGSVLLLDAAELVAEADRLGIAIWGFETETEEETA